MGLDIVTEHSFKGHQYIRIKGDCYTPPRGWGITLLTTDEFNDRNDQNTFRKIKPEDEFILNLHFS
jgi:hypothetical protein